MRGDLRTDSWERQISNRLADENKNYEVNWVLGATSRTSQ